MKHRRNGLSVLVIVAVAFGALTYTLINKNEPTLGLDLQGGISLVLKPAKKVKQRRTRADDRDHPQPRRRARRRRA